MSIDIWTRNFLGDNGGAVLLWAKRSDYTTIPLEGDQFGNLSVVSPDHYWTHEGKSYEASYMWSEGTAIADNANADLLLQIFTSMHIIYNINVGGDAEFRYYNNPTFTIPSPNGLVTAYNKNEYSSNTTSNLIYAGPTISSPGTLLSSTFIPGGAGVFSNGAAGQGFERERILKAQSPVISKLFRVTNRAGAAAAVSISLEWYEPY